MLLFLALDFGFGQWYFDNWRLYICLVIIIFLLFLNPWFAVLRARKSLDLRFDIGDCWEQSSLYSQFLLCNSFWVRHLDFSRLWSLLQIVLVKLFNKFCLSLLEVFVSSFSVLFTGRPRPVINLTLGFSLDCLAKFYWLDVRFVMLFLKARLSIFVTTLLCLFSMRCSFLWFIEVDETIWRLIFLLYHFLVDSGR